MDHVQVFAICSLGSVVGGVWERPLLGGGLKIYTACYRIR